MRNPVSAFGLATAVAALAGCATNVSPSGEAADAEVSSNATAIVVVEGTTGNDGTHADAVARFVKARGGLVDDDALRMVGAAVDFPSMGACAPLAPNRATAATQAHPLALLDVGAVSLLAGNGTGAGNAALPVLPVLPLARRQLPDVADLVSGVVYSARSDGLPSRSPYTLRVEGAPELDVAPFVVTATSPGEPGDLRVMGDDGRRGPVALVAGVPVEITWDGESVDDVVYVDLSFSSGGASGTITTRCLYADAGRATIPAAVLAADEGSFAVHRLHREPFHARGVDPGEVRFDFARVVPFVRR